MYNNTFKLVIRPAKDVQGPVKVSVAHVHTPCIWQKRRFMEMCALEIVTRLANTLKKMIAHVLVAILLAHSATVLTMMSASIVTMDLFV
jgi:hypothetical protein